MVKAQERLILGSGSSTLPPSASFHINSRTNYLSVKIGSNIRGYANGKAAVIRDCGIIF